ncbi:hypothetical protein BH11MYX1_BH11MYX1_36140 [soil metagenome]
MLKTTAFAIVTLACVDQAAAEGPPFTIGSTPSWIVLGGLTTGGTVALADQGALVGGEVSVARLRDANIVGFYADGYYDWGTNGTYVTGGLELGHKFLSLDGGGAARFAEGDSKFGLAARLTVGVGVVGVFARYAHFYDTMDNQDVLQVGLLLKLPLWTSGRE